MSTAVIHSFLTSLAFTVLVETTLLVFLIRTVLARTDLSVRRIVGVSALSSFATIPYVWFVFPYLYAWPRSTSLLYSEPFITLVEALCLSLLLKIDWRIALGLSIAANVASFLLGPWLRAQGLWIYW